MGRHSSDWITLVMRDMLIDEILDFASSAMKLLNVSFEFLRRTLAGKEVWVSSEFNQ
jgi:hypothetical protein